MIPALKSCRTLQSTVLHPSPIAILVTKDDRRFCTKCERELETKCKDDSSLLMTLNRHANKKHGRELSTKNACVIREGRNGELRITYDLKNLFCFSGQPTHDTSDEVSDDEEEEEKVHEDEITVEQEEENDDEEEDTVEEEEEKVHEEDGKSESSEQEENTKKFSNSRSGDYDHNVDACFLQTSVIDSRRCSLESPVVAGINRRGNIKDQEHVPPVSNVSRDISYISFGNETSLSQMNRSEDPNDERLISPQRDQRSDIYNGELNPGAHLTIEAEIGSTVTFKINGAVSELPSTGGVAPIKTTFNEQSHVFTASAMECGKWATLFKMINGPQAIIIVKFY